MRYLILVALLIGCAPTRDIHYPDEVKSFVQVFENLVGRVIYTPFEWEEQDSGILGICYRGEETYIGINQSQWGKLSVNAKEVVVLHELGHCELNRDHDNSTIPLGWMLSAPKSIMNAYNIGDAWVYKTYRTNHYLPELIGN